VRWGHFNSLGTKGCALRERTLNSFCENIAKPGLDTHPTELSCEYYMNASPARDGAPGRGLELISRLLWRHTEYAFKTADDAANRTSDNRANWSRRIVANRGTMGNAIGNALGVGI
jgi:hypothetical protein